MLTTVFIASLMTFTDNDTESTPSLMEPLVGNTYDEMIKALSLFCIEYWDELGDENGDNVPAIPDKPDKIVEYYFNKHPSDIYKTWAFNVPLTAEKEEAVENAAVALCCESENDSKAREKVAELLVGAFCYK